MRTPHNGLGSLEAEHTRCGFVTGPSRTIRAGADLCPFAGLTAFSWPPHSNEQRKDEFDPAGEGRDSYRLAAVLIADAHGYSRSMAHAEIETHAVLLSHSRVMAALVQSHEGRVVGSAGDSLLAEFPSVVQAVRAAMAIQDALRERNRLLAADRRLAFRIGVNAGDVIVTGGAIFGHSVNVAARLQALAEPGGIAVSGAVHEQVHAKVPFAFRDGGLQRVRNLPQPLRVWHVMREPEHGALRQRERAGEEAALRTAALSLLVVAAALLSVLVRAAS